LRPVHVVEGDRFNIKVTQPGDLAIAEMISNKREG
jgi:2-C-methyl-D-erythritol 4-phosphate cytidylyltransferase